MSEKHYLFGYGSLILKESRNIAGKTKESFPARIRGYQRVWGDRDEEGTYLTIKENSNSTCNGMIVEVPEEELHKFDEREEGQTRKQIKIDDIERLEDQNLPGGKYWIYVPNEIQTPSEKHPILQSYMDVVLTGCLEISLDFAKEFIHTTEGWKFIFNDRKNPLYPRALKDVNYKEEIGKLIEENLSQKLDK